MQMLKHPLRALCLTLLLAGTILNGCLEEEPPDPSLFHGTEWRGAVYAPLFTLENMDGSLWSLEEQRGTVVVLAFTYTRCENTCPVTEAGLNFIRTSLNEGESANVTFVSVTIDPWYDSPSHLTNWTSERGYDWPHLTGHPDAVNPVLTTYGVNPVDYEDNSTEGYGFHHTQPTYIIDEEGKPRVVWAEAEIPVDLFLQDLRLVLNGL